jgi:thiol:disulfide interchange protein DsbD
VTKRSRPSSSGFPGCAVWTALVLLPCLAAVARAAQTTPPVISPGVLAALGAAQVGGSKFPPPDEVFRFKAAPGAQRIRLAWTIRPGFYLYRSRIHVKALSGTAIGALTLPAGIVKVDPYFGREEIYRNAVTGTLVVLRGTTAAPRDASLAVTYQGCADAGLCYPPITKTVTVGLPPGASALTPRPARHAAAAVRNAAVPSQARFAGLVRSGHLLVMLGAFYLAGLALAFTPCCLPMIPILSALIAGGRTPSTGRSLLLAGAYVLGMAFTYSLAGIAAAAAGSEIQAAFQQPWILGAFAALLALMGLAMLGLFALQMPATLQTRLAQISSRRTAGTLGGVVAMGALSALIITTCVGPALVGALAVIGQSGQMARGGGALFALSIGMGTPLLAVGASAGRLLPKAGPWMGLVKKLFGAMMLAVAVSMLARLASGRVTLALWALPALAAAWALVSEAHRLGHGRWPTRTAGALALAYALALLTGAALGGTNPLAPLRLTGGAPALQFTALRSVAGLQRDVRRAAARHETVMVDFYADWCTSCKEMEATTFTDPAVRRALAHTVLLRADVTSNDAADQALLRYFGIYGPPTIAFYDRHGHERRRERVVGYLDAAAFLRRVRAAFGARPSA